MKPRNDCIAAAFLARSSHDGTTNALAGPHRHIVEPLVALLKHLDLQSSKPLLDFIRAQDWHVIDAQTRLVVRTRSTKPFANYVHAPANSRSTTLSGANLRLRFRSSA